MNMQLEITIVADPVQFKKKKKLLILLLQAAGQVKAAGQAKARGVAGSSGPAADARVVSRNLGPPSENEMGP